MGSEMCIRDSLSPKYEFLIEAISVLTKQTYSVPNNSKVYVGEYEKVESTQILERSSPALKL